MIIKMGRKILHAMNWAEVLLSFDVIDKIYCFCCKTGVPFSVKNLMRITSSVEFCKHPNLLTHLDLLCSICPNLYKKSGVTGFDEYHNQDDDIEVLVLKLKGVGKKSCSARRNIVREALNRLHNGPVPEETVVGERQEANSSECNTLSSCTNDHVGPVIMLPGNIGEEVWPFAYYGLKREQVSYVKTLPQKRPVFANLDQRLDFPLCCAVKSCLLISQFYKHQAIAINGARAGRNVVLCSGTSSGKSAAFLIPILEDVLKNRRGGARRRSTALLLYPTKALARDQSSNLCKIVVQLNALSAMATSGICSCGSTVEYSPDSRREKITCGLIDGDTSFYERERIRINDSIIVTNPDILHCTIIPQHKKWQAFISSLRFIVVDECHSYSGTFGTHFSCVLKRLQRICEHYGSRPQYIFASATASNPKQFIPCLIPFDYAQCGGCESNTTFVLPEDDCSPRGKRYIAVLKCFRPSRLRFLGDEKRVESDVEVRIDKKRKRSKPTDQKYGVEAIHNCAIDVVVKLFGDTVKKNRKVLVFCKSRRMVELFISKAAHDLRSTEFIGRIDSYRGGYSACDRKRIEHDFRSGALVGLVSTNALELGIDIGNIEVTIHVGIPDSLSSLWQQIGRCGRQLQESLSFVCCFESSIDQYVATNPDMIFSAASETTSFDPDDPVIIAQHIHLAASELPLHSDSKALSLWGHNVGRAVKALLLDGVLIRCIDGSLVSSKNSTVSGVRIRNIESTTIVLYNKTDGTVIDSVPYSRVFYEVYEGAVYLNHGKKFFVEKMDFVELTAVCSPILSPISYYTRLDHNSSLRISKILLHGQLVQSDGTISLGAVERTCYFGTIIIEKSAWRVSKIHLTTNAVFEHTDIYLRPLVCEVHAMWFTPLDNGTVCSEHGAAVHGAQHAMMIAAGIHLGFMIDTVACPHISGQWPGIMFHNNGSSTGSNSIRQLFDSRLEIVRKAAELIRTCRCLHLGCPACILCYSCPEANRHICKVDALEYLDRLLLRE